MPSLQPLNLNGQSQLSRSPSPLGHGHTRTYSTPLRSAPLPAADNAYARSNSVTPSEYPRQTGGLLIVNGSGSAFPASSGNSGKERASSEATVRREPQFGELDPRVLPDYSAPLASGIQFGDGLHQSNISSQPFDPRPLSIQTEHEARSTDSYGGTGEEFTQPFPAFNGASASATNPRQSFESVTLPHGGQAKRWIATKPASDDSNGVGFTYPPRTPDSKPIASRGPSILPAVAEIRTPSPTVQRRHDVGMAFSMNGLIEPATGDTMSSAVKMNGKVPVLIGTDPVPPTPISIANSSSTAAAGKAAIESANSQSVADNGPAQGSSKGPWETKAVKKKKTKPASKKKTTPQQQKAEGESAGQPVPLNEAERKGG